MSKEKRLRKNFQCDIIILPPIFHDIICGGKYIKTNKIVHNQSIIVQIETVK